jgi:hypothetical protein
MNSGPPIGLHYREHHTRIRERRAEGGTTMTAMLTAARAEALFTTCLATGSRPTLEVVDEAIRTAVRTRGGTRACAADVAFEFGDRPELAVPRMRWALATVNLLYPPRGRRQSWALVA